MIKILIADDNPTKTKSILSTLHSLPFINPDSITTVSDIFNARKHLSASDFDILILDLLIPDRHGLEASVENSLFLMQQLTDSKYNHSPVHIIGLTEHEDAKKSSQHAFDSYLFHIIHYDTSNQSWQTQLCQYISYYNKVISHIRSKRDTDYNFDLVITTALHDPELKAVLKLNANWNKYTLPNDATTYHTGIFSDGIKSLRVVTASQNQMGLTSAAFLSAKMIEHFRPKYIVNVGIAAGTPSIGDFGDILISDMTYEYTSGKTLPDATGNPYVWPDPKSIQLDPHLKEKFLNLQSNYELLARIKSLSDANKPKSELQVHIGPFGSGSTVVQSEQFYNSILNHQRKLIGIDMEAFATFYVAHNSSHPRPQPFSIKSISDFADSSKSNNFQAYASHTAAQFLYHFALACL